MKITSILSDAFVVLRMCDVKAFQMLSFLLIGLLASAFSISTIYIIFNFITETISIKTDLISATQNSENNYFDELQILKNIFFISAFITTNFAVQLLAIYKLHRFILLDEPTSSLDSTRKALVVKLVTRIVKLEHRCAVIVTHDNCFDEVKNNLIELK